MLFRASLLLLLGAIILAHHGVADSLTPTPPKSPPKSFTSPRSPNISKPRPLMGGRRGKRLQAYTVAEPNNNNNQWFKAINFPMFWENFPPKFSSSTQDSLFSFEGGLASKSATTRLMPNDEVAKSTLSVSQEVQALTASFKTLQSRNEVLEKNLQTLTSAVENQSKLIMKMQRERSGTVESNTNDLEGDNQMLRKRLRLLESELSDGLFETRKTMPEVRDVALTPKAPSVPPTSFQTSMVKQLQKQLDDYEMERSSVRKLVSLSVQRAAGKVGQALNLWNPVHNLALWGNLRSN